MIILLENMFGEWGDKIVPRIILRYTIITNARKKTKGIL
jgi:hypothetical protein